MQTVGCPHITGGLSKSEKNTLKSNTNLPQFSLPNCVGTVSHHKGKLLPGSFTADKSMGIKRPADKRTLTELPRKSTPHTDQQRSSDT